MVGASTAMCRFAAQAVGLGAAARAQAPDQAATNLATVRLIGGLAAPIGLLAWGMPLQARGRRR